jgi:hypothetical protein
MAEDSQTPVERYGRLADLDRSFDVEYWQRLGSHAIFEAAWQMVIEAHRIKLRDPGELRLQRSFETYGPIRSERV